MKTYLSERLGSAALCRLLKSAVGSAYPFTGISNTNLLVLDKSTFPKIFVVSFVEFGSPVASYLDTAYIKSRYNLE
jgi:hypothetical protein